MIRSAPPRVERVIIAHMPGTDLYDVNVQYGDTLRYVGYLKRSHRITVISDPKLFMLQEVRTACTRFHDHYEDGYEQADASRISID